MRQICLSALILLCIVLSACVGKMPLSPDRPLTMQGDQRLVVFTLTTKNNHRQKLLNPHTLVVERVDPVNSESRSVSFEDPERKISDREQFFVASLALSPGKYCTARLKGFTEIGFYPLPASGQFDTPFKRCFRVSADRDLYAGHVEATLVKKTSSDEERAGSIWPLADQLATGISTGTFKFSVTDNFDEDIAYVKHRYPITAGRTFLKGIMKEPGRFETDDPQSSIVPQEKQAPTSIKRPIKGKEEKRGCTVRQILEMRELGLSQAQIGRGCGE